MIPEMERRRIATQKTLDRFRPKAFCWRKGIHCVAMARTHLKNMGHRPPTLPRVRSALAARRALAERKWRSVEAMLDALLPRIAPAQMVVGDLAAVKGDGGLDAVMICAGPLKVFGWREDADGLVVLEVGLDELSGAWRA